MGIGFSPELVDGAAFGIPASDIYSTDGEFVVEGIGVYPDEGFEVYDLPEEIARGNDPCFETAVKYLLEQLEKNPPKKPKKTELPDRSGWHENMKD